MRPKVSPALRRVLEAEDPVSLLRDLIREPSHPGVPRQEERIAGRLAGYLRSAGLEVSLQEVRPGRPNLLARLPGGGGGRSLLLCGHTDTVPPGAVDGFDPFGAELRDGRVYGRGACDMKGALAAMACALVALARSETRLRGSVTLVAVIDEEMESLGAEHLIRSGERADGCVVGEPTANRVAIAHRGLEWLEVEFSGRAAHGSARSHGVNAIAAAARFVVLLEQDLLPALERRVHPLLGPPSLNVGRIEGGDSPSSVAARCRVQLDRRWLPSEAPEQICAEIETLLERVRNESPGLITRLGRAPGGMATMVHGPLETPADHPLVSCALEARTEAGAEPESPVAFGAWSDAALLWREAGIPCVVMGPGELSQAHSADEWVGVADVRRAVWQYALLARAFCK